MIGFIEVGDTYVNVEMIESYRQEHRGAGISRSSGHDLYVQMNTGRVYVAHDVSEQEFSDWLRDALRRGGRCPAGPAGPAEDGAMSPEPDADDPLVPPVAALTEMFDAAQQAHQMFTSFRVGGFTEDQALKLTAHVIVAHSQSAPSDHGEAKS